MKHARKRKELLFFLSNVLDLDGSFSRRDGYKQTDWTHWTERVGSGGLVEVCTCVADDLFNLINFAYA